MGDFRRSWGRESGINVVKYIVYILKEEIKNSILKMNFHLEYQSWLLDRK